MEPASDDTSGVTSPESTDSATVTGIGEQQPDRGAGDDRRQQPDDPNQIEDTAARPDRRRSDPDVHDKG